MNEIGGYFGLEKLISREYYKNLLAINTARNCLLYLLKAKNIKKLYIPYFNCDSISDMCRRNGYEYEYYHIDSDFMPLFAKETSAETYLYIINYYGRITETEIRSLKRKYNFIIIDNAQAFFQKPLDGIDTFYSCRKFFGVPDGAYLSTDVKLEEELETDISGRRMTHILGRYEETAVKYYSYFIENDESFKREPLKYMSSLTHNLLGAVDYEQAYCARNNNYCYLAKRLDCQNRLRPAEPNGAYAYPFYAANAMEIRRILAEKKIYVAVLWPNVLNEAPQDSLEYDYSAHILPLPCDQRYTTEDMQYILDELKKAGM